MRNITRPWITHVAMCISIFFGVARGYNDVEECEDYRARQVVYVSDSQSLRELHIRHNLQVFTEQGISNANATCF